MNVDKRLGMPVSSKCSSIVNGVLGDSKASIFFCTAQNTHKQKNLIG